MGLIHSFIPNLLENLGLAKSEGKICVGLLMRKRKWENIEKNWILSSFILKRVFCTPVNSLCSSSDSFIFASSRLPNTYVCHRTIFSERELKECGVRECTTTRTCCSRCATNIEESNNTVCRDSNARSDIVSKKYKTKLAQGRSPRVSKRTQKTKFGS